MSGNVQRILVIRLSAIGDVVMASGLIPSLRQLYPNAHLAWLAEPAAAPLLVHNPRLDEVIVWQRGEWQQLWRQRRYRDVWQRLRALRRQLREGRFDLVIDAQGLLKSGVWSWLSGATRRVTLVGREGSHRLATERVMPPEGADATSGVPRLIGSEYRHLAAHLGATPQAYRLDLAVGSAAREVAWAQLDALGVPGGAYAVLCPFTTRPQKHWFEDRWAELAQQLAERGLQPVLLGGPADREAAARIAAQAPVIANLAGRLKLDESVAVIESTRVLIGVDTGLTHMGSALRRPTVALFGSTCPYQDGDSLLTSVMYDCLPCSPCRRRPTCGGRFDCMRSLEVDAVLARAQRMMEMAG
ncbi:glycosyltransferase family 9 protein [Caldimonas brevitalea]|uniref:Lipopolysaccharide heptosyltransferase n=1 Tax=Caldimonas brevitalea TaxID=413882 RepID=A0A0G3BTC4_9BURK|nr:glycosyltransferase family 9 protein [Caldimonas brevitalea]AKJ30626.1 lipopolysaccharide heptosyltransferase [Caldimonas brevitalea]